MLALGTPPMEAFSGLTGRVFSGRAFNLGGRGGAWGGANAILRAGELSRGVRGVPGDEA